MEAQLDVIITSLKWIVILLIIIDITMIFKE